MNNNNSIHPSDKCKAFMQRVKFGKMRYCLAKIIKTDDNETIETFYVSGKDNENAIGNWETDDEKLDGVKKAAGKKPKRVKGEFETAVWEPFCKVVTDELTEGGGWAMISVEYKDTEKDVWTDKILQICYTDDGKTDKKKMFAVSSSNPSVSAVSAGFINIKVLSAEELTDLKGIIDAMNK